MKPLAVASIACVLSACALAPPPEGEALRNDALPNVKTPANYAAGGLPAPVRDEWLGEFRDAELEFHFLCKVAHELRKLQRRAIVTGRRQATGRLAMFLEMLAQHQSDGVQRGSIIKLPMSRTDIAEYLNLTPEAVSRAITKLGRDGVAVSTDRHSVRILDSDRFNQLVGGA